MHSVEISAKSLEEARKVAAFQLGVSEDEIDIEILEEPRKILGVIGSGQYRIRATYMESKAEAVTPADEPEAPDEEAPVAEAPITPPEAQPTTEPAPAVVSPPAPVTEQPDDPISLVAERARQITEDIIALMGIPQRVTITNVGPEQVELTIEDDDEQVELLIGRQGAPLDALQLIVAIAANCGIQDGCRVILDAHDYRQRRADMLRDMAHSLAIQVKETGREEMLTDLKGYDRRIIHLELRDDPDVETYSVGEGRERQLIIAPTSSPSCDS